MISNLIDLTYLKIEDKVVDDLESVCTVVPGDDCPAPNGGGAVGQGDVSLAVHHFAGVLCYHAVGEGY